MRQALIATVLTTTGITDVVSNSCLQVAQITAKTKSSTKSYLSSAIARKDVSFESITDFLSDKTFKRDYRLNRTSFTKLVNLIRQLISKNKEMGRRSGRPAISPEIRLGITLSRLAGGSFDTIHQLFRVQRSTVHSISKETCTALSALLNLPGIPDDFDRLTKLSNGFKTSQTRVSPLTGCIGALDGIAITTMRPLYNAVKYWCRKGYYAIPVQAVVDSRGRFLFVSAKCVGSTHDSLAYASSKLSRFLDSQKLPIQFCIAGDEAYICTDNDITPIPISQVNSLSESGFNFFLSSLRIHVEQAFGRLVARWRILQSTLNYSVTVSGSIIVLCMKLQNFIIEEDGERVRGFSALERSEIEDDVCKWYRTCKDGFNSMAQVGDDESLFVSSKSSRKRDQMVEIIRRRGLCRPGEM